MRETLIIIGLLVLAVALRSCRTPSLRKLGALVLLVFSFSLFSFLSGNVWVGCLGIVAWFFLPWLELLTRVRRLRLPMENRLIDSVAPKDAFFPNAVQAVNAIGEAGFDHVTDSGWEWAGMEQHFRIFWHPEEKAVATVCLCEQDTVAFAFISITSRGCDGEVWRTTNFPFSPTLKCACGVGWNHVPCEQSCFHKILSEHQNFLKRLGKDGGDLLMPDPDRLVDEIEQEMKLQIEHNLRLGVIKPAGSGEFMYSWKGLCFLWWQQVKDMVRLC